jgi:hypothetical protein
MQLTNGFNIQGFTRAARQLGFASPGHLLEDRSVTRRILEQHLLPYIVTVDDLQPGLTLRTMDFGSPLTVQRGR